MLPRLINCPDDRGFLAGHHPFATLQFFGSRQYSVELLSLISHGRRRRRHRRRDRIITAENFCSHIYKKKERGIYILVLEENTVLLYFRHYI